MHARTHARTHFPGGAMVNNLLVNAGDAKDVSSIPGWERSSGLGKGNHSSILAWKIPRTEEPGRSQRVGQTEHARIYIACTHIYNN